jgi:cell division protein FtsQ
VARGNRRKVDRVPGERRRWLARSFALVLPTAVALAGLAGAGLAAWKIGIEGPALRIRAISFEGLSRVSDRELLELSTVLPGDHLLLADLDRMQAALARHPWVEAVAVRRTMPPGLVVTVTERRAAALVDLGGLYLIDRSARVFKRAAPGDGLDLPVVTGIARDEWVERRAEVEPLLASALALVDLWAARGLDRQMPVAEIHVDRDYGTTLFVGDGAAEVRLGTGDLPDKLSRLSRVLDALEADGREADVVHLDNRRRPDWVTVRVAGRWVPSLRAKGQPDQAAPERAGGLGGRRSLAPPQQDRSPRGP